MLAPRTYELDCPLEATGELVEREIVEPLLAGGYSVGERSNRELTLCGMRRPRWAVLLAIFLFPLGLPLLVIRRPRTTRMSWSGEPPMLAVEGDDPPVRHLAASIATVDPRAPRLVEVTAPCFAAGAASVLIAWIAAVQLIEPRPLFVAAILVGVAIGSGIGTAIGMRRAARAEDPRNPIVWGALPALAGGLAMASAFVALVLFLVVVGAGE